MSTTDTELVADDIISILNNTIFPSNSVIVYDIDDTLISYSGMPIEPIINTYRVALDRGLIPVIITSRGGRPDVIKYTIEQLHNAGIYGYKYLYLRPIPDYEFDPWRFKRLCRKDLHDHGYYVAMSIGDQPWDVGQYGGMGIVLPSTY